MTENRNYRSLKFKSGFDSIRPLYLGQPTYRARARTSANDPKETIKTGLRKPNRRFR